MQTKINKLCKICGSNKLKIYRHTAKCENCKVLLYYPYPKSDTEITASGDTKTNGTNLEWYLRSSFSNHINFTNMLLFTIKKSSNHKEIDILDFGGGGGQFALVCKSHFPLSKIYITDINDNSLLNEWSNYNIQINHDEFLSNNKKFDYIFLNDVFEHLSDPIEILTILSNKLKSNGKIFIDTPRQFWIYPITKLISKKIYNKVLNGSVSTAHLQIWSNKSFQIAINKVNLFIHKYEEIGEFTMDPDYYLDNMKINSYFLRLLGKFFFYFSKLFLKNKIICVLKKNSKFLN